MASPDAGRSSPFSFRVIVRRQSTLTSGESETGSHSPARVCVCVPRRSVLLVSQAARAAPVPDLQACRHNTALDSESRTPAGRQRTFF